VGYALGLLIIALVGSLLVNVVLYRQLQSVTDKWFSLVDDALRTREAIREATQVYPRESMDWTLKQPGVYVIRAQGWCKIGRASDVARRLHEHRTSIPRGFEIVAVLLTSDCVALESALHQQYQSYQKRGEWFELPDPAIAHIKSLEANYKGR
jgi:predicted GIY-YIG superfamily endonuclease